MATSVISIRLPDEVKDQLEILAKATNRSRSFLINKAIEDLVRRKAWHAQQLHESLAEADQGMFVSEQAVDVWLKSWGTDEEGEPPKPDVEPARLPREP